MKNTDGEIVRFIEFICFDKRMVECNSAERITHFKDAAIFDRGAAIELYDLAQRRNESIKEKVYERHVIRFIENGEEKQEVFFVNFDDMRFAVPIIDAVIYDRVQQQVKSYKDTIQILESRIAVLESALYKNRVPLWRRIKNAILAHNDDKKWFEKFLNKRSSHER